MDNDTAGGLKKRIESGEAFDVAVITPAVIDELAGAGKIAAGSRVNLASVSIGVVVKEGAPRPDVSTVDAFKRALLEAKSVAYIDPASGAQAASTSTSCWNGLASPTGYGRNRSSKTAAMSPTSCERRSRTRPASDQRNRPGQGAALVGPLPKESRAPRPMPPA